MLVFTTCYAAPDLRVSHHSTDAGPEGGIPDSNITAALALIDKVRSKGHVPQTWCDAEQLTQPSCNVNKS